MSDDIQTSVEEFLDAADEVFGEYDQGYMDADAALSLLETHIDDLEESVEG